MGQSSLQVLRGLLSQEGGFGAAFVKRLYAGVAGAAMCSVVVGAVHFAVSEQGVLRSWLTRDVRVVIRVCKVVISSNLPTGVRDNSQNDAGAGSSAKKLQARWSSD